MPHDSSLTSLLTGSKTVSEIPTSGVIVGAEHFFRSEPPGLARIQDAEGKSGGEIDQWVALGIDLSGLAPPVARESLAWIQERLARGEAFRLDEHEEEVELIRERPRIMTILEGLMAREARGYAMRLGSCARPSRVVPARLTIEGTVLLEHGGAAGIEAPFDVQLEGFQSVYQFRWSEDPMLEPPEAIVRVRRRRHRRALAPFRLRARFTHPLWDSIVVNAPIHDLSFEGISLDTDATRDILYPGLVIHDLEIFWKGAAPIRCGASVRHVTQRARSLEHRVGVRLRFSPETAERWHREVEGVLHPTTRRSLHGPEVFWENYTESGYFNLSGKKAEDFADQRAAFEQAHAKLCAAPEVGASFSFSSERRVESVAHQVSPWAGSWVFYHFSRRPDSRPLSAAGDEALLDLYAHAYEYIQQQPHAQWLVTYVQKKARFSSLIFRELTTRYFNQGRACLTDFRALEIDTSTEVPQGPKQFDVGAARRDELMLVSGTIRSSRPNMYVSATGLSQADLGIDATRHAWASAGLERERRVLVARDGDRVVAAAVIDVVAEGVHLFGLFDIVRLYAVSAVGHSAFDALLEAARRFFCGLGRKRFAYFGDSNDDPSAAERRGTTDLGDASMTILPVRLLPELLEHVFVLTSRRASASRRAMSDPPENLVRLPSDLPSPSGGQ